MSTLEATIEKVKSRTTLGTGAQFWVYISPSHDTKKYVTQWSVTFSQGNWTGKITSENPEHILKTPGLSGVFTLKVEAGGPKFPIKKLNAQQDCNPDIGCNTNCSGMVSIIANPSGTDAQYCTTWDAFCSKDER